jgi:hypothetical protein
MSVDAILDSVQYVVDKDGQQTAVLLDLPTWDALRLLLEEFSEDERLGRLMDEVEDDETFEGEASWNLYQSLLSNDQS